MASDAEFLQCLYASAALEFWIIIINRYCGDLTVSTIKMFREIINELLVVWSRELKRQVGTEEGFFDACRVLNKNRFCAHLWFWYSTPVISRTI